MNVPVCHSVIKTVQGLQMPGCGSNGSLIDVKTLIKFLREAAVKQSERRLCQRFHTEQQRTNALPMKVKDSCNKAKILL